MKATFQLVHTLNMKDEEFHLELHLDDGPILLQINKGTFQYIKERSGKMEGNRVGKKVFWDTLK